jgi:hypothetical protein
VLPGRALVNAKSPKSEFCTLPIPTPTSRSRFHRRSTRPSPVPKILVAPAGIRIQNSVMSGFRFDSILYEGERYVILGGSPYDGLFDPQQFGITLDSYTSSPRALACAYCAADLSIFLTPGFISVLV